MREWDLFWVEFLVYWASYVVIRPKLGRKNRWWRVGWLANTLLALGMIWSYGMKEEWMRILSVLMAVGVVGHHGGVWLRYSRFNHRYSHRLHMAISHWLFFVPFGIVGVFGGGGLILAAVSGITAVVGVLVGMEKIKVSF